MICQKYRESLELLVICICCGLFLLPRVSTAQTAEPDTTAAEADSRLEVTEIIMAAAYDTELKQPLEPASIFPADIGKVYCYTRIKGATTPTEITHVWYFEGKTMAKVNLALKSTNYRTYSSKNILPSWQGKWEVKVLDESETVIATAGFTIE